ncbi:MAG: D-alanyl-D-alanine carboxypeptidase/D-alanyl-D-alanine-endopeptidase [Rhodobacteraceae bacterium]|nr:D-alanyl-D-alanine carboxypeptidase/D-alanyl-D-alanine-endopeptidase [Paracoccaceae bacterium]
MKPSGGNPLSRRFVLGGLAAGFAGAAQANAPLQSLRPPARAAAMAPASRLAADAGDLIRAAALGGAVGYLVADAKTGAVHEAMNAATPMPPASVLKVVTSLYALDALGGSHRFATRLHATGPVRDGRLRGDLILAGGGDPALTTDDLGDMAAALRKAGVKAVEGRFLVWGGALPYIEAIDETQPVWLGYNPAVSGLNLNFNRVNFVWKRTGSGYDIGMDARAERYAPAVTQASVTIADRDLPVYTFRSRGTDEEWTVAKSALGNGGSRWLPVRHPPAYAGDVFRTLARAQGVSMPAPEETPARPGGTVLVEHRGDALTDVLRDMMKYSNNMTAETVGMAASLRHGVTSHAGSGQEMTRWARASGGCTTARFADHSGLAGASRISPEDMVRVLVTLAPKAGLRDLLKPVPFTDAKGRTLKSQPAEVQAKTGTLNFVSTLAGYVRAPNGADLAFAIFTGDIARRDAIPESQRERPAGGRAWVRSSKNLQQALIERWLALYA